METAVTHPKKSKALLAEQVSFTDEQLALMKNTVAKGATDDEFLLLLHLAKTYGLDPFAKEIWCIKYVPQGRDPRDFPATIFSSRDGYLKIASRDKQMDGIQSDVVYENDVLRKLVDGTVEHTYGNPRGAIIGAYALVFRKDRSRPAYFYAPLKEYNSGKNPTWAKYPSAMIVKVAEAMALKRAFSISGLVTQEEMGLDMVPVQQAPAEQDAGTSAVEVVAESPAKPAAGNVPAATASTFPAPSATSAPNPADELLGPLTPRTKKLIQLAVEAYDCEQARGAGAEQRLLDSLKDMSEKIGQQTLRFLEKQPKKKASTPTKKPLTASAKAEKADTSLTDEFRDHPTTDDRSPVQFASKAQKDEIERLLAIPCITRPEKVVLLLNIHRLDEARAQDAIVKLQRAIDEREGGAGAAVEQAMATAA